MSSDGKNCYSNIVKRKTRKSKLENILDEIQQEYGLKRIQFNPDGPSPNIFMKKLDRRMNAYYHTLSNNRISFKK
jgi:hypothetical protein